MAGKSPKKRKVSGGNAKVTLQVEDPNPHGNPVVVSFPGGVPESAKGERSRPQFLWQKLNQKSSKGRKVTGEDKHCVYSSQAKGLAYDDRRTKMCVGVYDKRRKVLILREAASRGTVFALEQSVPSYLEKNGVVEQLPNQDLLGYSKQVYQDFGSAKKQRVLKSQAANQVDIDHVVGGGAGSAVVANVLNGKSMSESNRKAIEETKTSGITTTSKAVANAHEASRRNFLPAYDDNAVKPDKAYSAKDIAGERAWTRVTGKVHACMHKDDVATAVLESIFERDWNASVVKIIKEMSPDSKGAKERYTCAMLCNWLIQFYSTNHRRRSIPTPNETKATYYGLPVEVASRWVTLFTTSIAGEGGRISHAMSKQNKDKCIIHALLLYMMSQGIAMKIGDVRPIAEDMKVTVNDCATMLRLAGCTVTKKGKAVCAVLKTPLTFPPPKRAIGRGR